MNELNNCRKLLAEAIMRKQNQIADLHKNHAKAMTELDGLIAQRKRIINKMESQCVA